MCATRDLATPQNPDPGHVMVLQMMCSIMSTAFISVSLVPLLLVVLLLFIIIII